MLGALALGACSDDASPPASTTSVPPTSAIVTTTVTTTTTTTTSAPSTTTAPTTTVAVVTTTTGAPPPTVTEVRAGPGGGSGEITVTWRAVPGAASYRVERADAPGGPFATGGVIGTDGSATKGAGVVNLFASADGTFTYVEVVGGLSNGGVQRWFRIVAQGPGGAAAPSRVVCGSPPGAPAC